MGWPVFMVPAGDVIPIFFTSYDGATGASEAISGLAVTDIEIYKDGSITQRSSDAGYALIDTDGIDVDGIVGLNGFTVDTGDNTDASFYTVGAWFTVVVSAITADGQTVNFIAAQFRIMAAEGVAAVPDVNVTHLGDTAQTAGDLVGILGPLNTGAADGAVTTTDTIVAYIKQLINTLEGTPGIPAWPASAAPGNAVSIAEAIRQIYDEVSGINGDGMLTQANVRSAVGLASANLDTQLAKLDVIDDFLDTEVAAIKAKTDNLPSDPADASVVAGLIAAVPAAVLAEVIEGAVTLLESIRLWNAALGGKASGLETTTAVYRDLGDTKDRISATVDADGNRSAVTLDLT